MLKKVLNTIYLFLFLSFLVMITFFYFSAENITKTNKFRTLYSFEIKDDNSNLTILKNDTNNIIEYKNDVEIFKNKKKKYKFWNLIKKENNE